MQTAMRAGEGARGPQFLASDALLSACRTKVRNSLIRNNLENDCIVQLRILLRKRCGHFNLQSMHHGGSRPCLALQQLGNGLQRDSVQPECICWIGHGKRGQHGNGG